MSDPHQNNQKIDPKVLERLEDDWDYDIDSPETGGDYKGLNFSLGGFLILSSASFVLRFERPAMTSRTIHLMRMIMMSICRPTNPRERFFSN